MGERVILIPEKDIRIIRLLADEMDRTLLLGQALKDRLDRELFLATGVNVQVGEWELDTERGVLVLYEEEEHASNE